MQSFQLDICDMKLSVRSDADPERMEKVQEYINEHYARFRAQSGSVVREKLLIMLLIGLADDFLQMKEQSSKEESKLDLILHRLEGIELNALPRQ